MLHYAISDEDILEWMTPRASVHVCVDHDIFLARTLPLAEGNASLFSNAARVRTRLKDVIKSFGKKGSTLCVGRRDKNAVDLLADILKRGTARVILTGAQAETRTKMILSLFLETGFSVLVDPALVYSQEGHHLTFDEAYKLYRDCATDVAGHLVLTTAGQVATLLP